MASWKDCKKDMIDNFRKNKKEGIKILNVLSQDLSIRKV